VIRLGYDLSILRHPHAGTARYAEELLAAMTAATAPGDSVLPTQGLPRGPRGLRFRRYVHLAEDLAWWGVGGATVAARNRVSAWFSPSNTLLMALPRPMIVTIHDANFVVHPEAYDHGYRVYANRMFRHAARHAARILTDSAYSAGELVRLLDAPTSRIVVAYPGLDHALRVRPDRPDPSLPGRYALCVGQTEPHKNIGLLVEAWRVGVPQDLHLVIAGPPGRDDERLRELASRSVLRERIHFLGSVSEGRLARLYESATCFLLPSRAEGFGFPPLEAMARGVPTAVAAEGSLPEVTAEGALHFDCDDASALAGLIHGLADDDRLRRQLARKGKRVARRYRWTDTARVAWATVRGAIKE
jgi:glycosyltransferase involved in cell wall biosynthesis